MENLQHKVNQIISRDYSFQHEGRQEEGGEVNNTKLVATAMAAQMGNLQKAHQKDLMFPIQVVSTARSE